MNSLTTESLNSLINDSNELSFTTSGKRNISHHVLQFLYYSVIPLPQKRVLASCCLTMDFRICLLLQERVFGKPLASNGLLLWLQYSIFQVPCHNINEY
jgi:hypothetical protein